MSVPLFNGAVMTIFAREVLEGTVIIGQYRTVVQRSPDWADPEKQKQGLKAINMAAGLAALVALVLIIIVGVVLAVLSRGFDEKIGDIIEGVSKVVAAFCILQLSLKMPKFLGCYASKKGADGVEVGLTLKSIRFNVAWNIWREVAEIGVFLIPFFLEGEKAKAIPLSGLAGCAVGALLGGIVYIANKKMKNKTWLAVFMAVLLLFLATGLFTGGMHEFEEVWGMTPNVYNYREAAGGFFNEKKLPMAMVKPFGFSAKRSVLQIASFWTFLCFGCLLHFWKWLSTKKIREAQELAEQEKAEAAEAGEKTLEMQETTPIDEKDSGTDEENQSGGDDENV
jgi:high-affinity iron transporter